MDNFKIICRISEINQNPQSRVPQSATVARKISRLAAREAPSTTQTTVRRRLLRKHAECAEIDTFIRLFTHREVATPNTTRRIHTHNGNAAL